MAFHYIVSWFAYLFARVFFFFLALLPIRVRLVAVEIFLRCVTAFIPGYRRVSRKNLALAFPNESEEWRNEVLSRSYASLARVVVDFGRLHQLAPEWFDRHVSVPNIALMKRLDEEYPQTGILIATGHLGSFELMAYSAGHYGYPLSYVVRNFKLDKLDQWWKSVRERNGNKVLDRKGAFKKIVRELRSGRNVGVLFDQNVRRSFAVFVEWFNRPAATTKALGLAALRTGAPIVVASITHSGDDNYTIHLVQCDYSDLRTSPGTADEKVLIITERISKIYEDMIRASPAEWFWMHRRWKTVPFGMQENFYSR